MGDLCYKLLVTQLTKFIEVIANSSKGGNLRFVSLRHGRPRFNVEVAYSRMDCGFVLSIWSSKIYSCSIWWQMILVIVCKYVIKF